jgi:hypothetical protein
MGPLSIILSNNWGLVATMLVPWYRVLQFFYSSYSTVVKLSFVQCKKFYGQLEKENNWLHTVYYLLCNICFILYVVSLQLSNIWGRHCWWAGFWGSWWVCITILSFPPFSHFSFIPLHNDIIWNKKEKEILQVI